MFDALCRKRKDMLCFSIEGTVLIHLQQEHRRVFFLTRVVNLIRRRNSVTVQPLAMPLAVNFSCHQIKR